jgi:hypothetical protein
MMPPLAGRGCSPWRPQGEAALVAALSYIGAVAAAAISAASASALLHEAIIAAATGSAGGFIGLVAAALIRRMRSQTDNGDIPAQPCQPIERAEGGQYVARDPETERRTGKGRRPVAAGWAG